MNKTALRHISLVLTLTALMTSGCSQLLGQDPEASCDFVQNNNKQRVSWKSDLPLKFRVHKDVPKEAHEVIQIAASKWNKVSTKNVITIIKWDSEISPENGYSDGAPTIYWLRTWETDRKNEQARTTVVWSDDKIRDADIKINAKNFSFNFKQDILPSNKVDFVSLMVHEMGHALGFAHADEKDSVMYPLLASGMERRDVSELGDLESYACEYGDSIVEPKVLAAALNGGEVEEEQEVVAEITPEEDPEEQEEVAVEVTPDDEPEVTLEDNVTHDDEVSSASESTEDESLI